MTTSRIKIDSTSNRIDVYKNLPSTDPNKIYMLTIEDLVIPKICDSLVLDGKKLFTVRRRIRVPGDGVADDDLENNEFTPQHCRNVAELLWQINDFFRTMILKSIHEGFGHNLFDHQYTIPPDFTQNAGNWHTTIRNSARGSRAQHALSAIFRSDGRIGFRFSVDALKLFILDLTAEGRRVLGWPRRCIAIDNNGFFNRLDYMAIADDVNFDLQAAGDLSDIECFMDGSVFSHNTYRHEVVLNSSIPLQRKIEFTNDKQKFSVQLASYRYKSDIQDIEYEQRDRWLINKHVNVFHFENSMATNNRYVLSHTDMQNFHVRLMSRNYHYAQDTGIYESKEEPYIIPDGAFWYLTLAITPL